ncbi:MAG: beta-ketoacyl-ACP synthase II [Clostridiales bacterium]|nr:beta-ketoacyl-ACP synthase II [Clostridiales bacterium]MBB1553466.1 beta-ketoacyl-ACP synthase II [Clostridiales bacterium]MBF0926691.1 beta-ketoacyl-ACP synthase II [Clostridiales bacterium]
MKRVVITGMGTINPIGHNVNETWESIKNKECGIQEISLIDSSTYKTKFDAEIKNYDPNEFFDPKTAKRNDRYTQLGMIAAREAVKDSGITPENSDYSRIGTYFSSGIGGLTTIQEQCKIYFEKGNTRVSPLFIPMGISNMAAGTIAIEYGFKGESMSIVTACASSAHAIGEAYRAIQLGEEDIILAGGSEASINEVALAGFENMKALTHATEVNRASIPFDAERSGFVMGEGAGAIILEELEHAKARGAKIYAELIGYGSTTDAYHITSPSPDGEGGANAMKRALKNANIKPEEVDYINAHGTSTHLNDATETKAIKTAFGEHAKKLMVSSTKGNTGHLLGGAGVLEAIISVKAINDSLVPPTINYKVKDEECDLDIVPNEPRKADIKVAMSNSLGFGGHNATIILRKYEE